MRATLARRASLGLAVAALALSIVLSACGQSDDGAQEGQARLAEEELGIRIVRVSLTAGGGIVDLRYQVTNEEKAALALGESAGHHGAASAEEIKNSPLLIDEDSGYAVLEAPLHLLGRSQKQRLEPKAGLTRFILFTNTGGFIERGSKVALAIGDLRVEHLVVQ